MKLTPIQALNIKLEMHVDECRECFCVRRLGMWCEKGNEIRQEIDDLISKCEMAKERRLAA